MRVAASSTGARRRSPTARCPATVPAPATWRRDTAAASTTTLSAPTISGCTLSGNYAGLSGGGVYNAGRLTALNSIFSGNYDFPESGGNYPDNIYNVYGSSYYTDGGGNTFS